MELNGKNPLSPLGLASSGGGPLTNREDHSREIGVAEGLWPELVRIRTVSGSQHLGRGGRGRTGRASGRSCRFPRIARGPIRLLPANHQSLSDKRRRLCQGNLDANASLLASAGIMADYVINVAVGISAGVAGLVSAVPALHACTLPLCLGILALLTFVNLRDDGCRSAARTTHLSVRCVLHDCSAPRRIRRHDERRTSTTARASGRPARSHRGGWAMVITTRVRQRLYDDDRRRGDQQRCRRIPRAVRGQRPVGRSPPLS